MIGRSLPLQVLANTVRAHPNPFLPAPRFARALSVRFLSDRRLSHKPSTTSSIAGLLVALRALGVPSLKWRLVWLATCSFFAGLAQASLLVIISEFAVNSAQGRSRLEIHGHSFSIADVIVTSAILLTIYAGTSIAAALTSSSISSRALVSVRRELIDAFFSASWALQSEERLGHIQQLLTVNCESVGEITVMIAARLQALLTVAALLGAAFLVSPVAAAIVLVLGSILSVALRPFNSLSRKAAVLLSEASHAMATLVTEYTRLTREFRLFGVEQQATTVLSRRSEIAARTSRKTRFLAQLSSVTYQTLALLFVIGALAVVAGHTGSNLGATAAVLLLMLRSMAYGSVIQSTSQALRHHGGFLETIRDELDRFCENTLALGTGELPVRFDISVKNVSFSYDERGPALQEVSFFVRSGQCLGIVGRSGSGKTTLSQILLGLREPTDGIALVGDVPVTKLTRTSGVSPVALVAQDPVLLQGSIAFNISFFRDIANEDVEAASRAAHLHEDVIAMPDTYQTRVGEGGTALSGGQRQRLALARALAGAPRMLVLDEPTSALDARSESLIRTTLRELRGRVTLIIISHRLGLIEDCDLLLVLNSGRVADFGAAEDVSRRLPFREVAESITGEAMP